MPPTTTSEQPGPEKTHERVTGVQLMQGIGHRESRGFWAEAWAYVIKKPGAIFGLSWLAVVIFFAVFAPVIASGHPIIYTELLDDGSTNTRYPLLEYLTAVDVLLMLFTIVASVCMLFPENLVRNTRGARLPWIMGAGLQIALTFGLIKLVGAIVGQVTDSEVKEGTWLYVSLVTGALVAAVPFFINAIDHLRSKPEPGRLISVVLVGVLTTLVVADRWNPPLPRFEYRTQEQLGKAEALFTIVPFSPYQGSTSGNTKEPGLDIRETLAPRDENAFNDADLLSQTHHKHYLGTNSLGNDVLSQMLHACRLSISIGLVSTGIAVFIGVTLGALMGYFGGWVDTLLYRLVEIFMAIPVLFLLIVAAAVLPRNTYVMMAVIGCVTWTSAARFIRAEFFKLRSQDFVQSARAVGLPLRSVLFKHMLPNGVTPVLVESSFAIAAAINFEAVLSFLGLGPADQASWGGLLADATNQVGAFIWWLAIFPGFAIFLTVLSYNLIGEALRDGIDPKLKKARV